MLATELARKHKQSSLPLHRRVFAMQCLLARGADSTTIRETLLWYFHDIVEAAFLLIKHDDILLAEARDRKREVEYEVPPGLFTNEITARVQVAS